MNVYEARHAGRTYCCDTEGSEHYHAGGKGNEPIDDAITMGLEEGFCLINIIKYAKRYRKTRNLNDLKKVSDYAHVLCGIELLKNKPEPITDKPSKWEGLDNDDLQEKVCDCFAENCGSCPIPNLHHAVDHSKTCFEWIAQNPEEARELMIGFLESQEGQE